MFGSSNLFGQSSNSSALGTQTQSVFGQTNNASNNPFAPKSSGTSTPFGAQTGSSMFGQPQPSSPFGASLQAFGSSTSAFGASSAPAFGSSASPFGGSSTFGQKSLNASLFGSTTQQSQPAFGNSTIGSSTPFGASSTPAIGASSMPAFGASSTPAFGASSTPAFGASNTSTFGATTTPTFAATGTPGFGNTSTPGFGATSTPGFGTTSTPGFGASSTPGFGASSITAFGSTNTPAFVPSSTPSFGASSSPAYGASTAQAFGSSGAAFGNNTFGSGGAFGGSSTSAFDGSNTSAFGAFSTPAFGASKTPAFGVSSTPSFSFGSSPGFGQSTSAFGSGSSGSTQSPFGAQGAQASTPTFGGQSTSGVQQGGSRVMPYTPTTEADSGTGKLLSGKLQSISAMSVYKEKNHGELRWEDYQRGDKGGELPVGRSPGGAGSGVTNPQPSIFSPSPTFSQTTANPANLFSSSIATNPFAQKASATFPSFSSSFDQNTTPSTPSIVWSTTSSNSTSGVGSFPGFATTKSQPFSSTPAFSTGGNFNNSYSSPLFSSYSSFGQNTTSVFGPTSSAVAQTNNLITPSTGYGNLSSSSSSLTTNISPYGQTTPAGLTIYPSVQPSKQPSGAFDFNNSGQTGNTTGVTGGTRSLGLGNFGSVSASSVAMLPPLTNPFGTLPASPQISISQGGNLPSNQYGISSMPVVDKPAPVRRSLLLTSRNLLHRRDRLPTRKYRPDDDGPKVPFFSNLEENSSTPKASVLFSPRENPRALFTRPMERLRSEDPKDGLTSLHENGKPDKNNGETREFPLVKPSQKPNGTHESHGGGTNGSHSTSPSGVDNPEYFTEPRIQEQVTKEVDIESLMPKLHHPEYFTEPRIQELATKEKVDPGYCKRVKDFVVGRHGYGSIKFLGETDVSRLDLEMSVRFANREVNVYMDEAKKPPVGKGLNKPALVTLLNIKCMDKKSGRQVKEGERLDKYKEMLKKKAEEQGAKFVFYDAVNGVWTFKVEHF